MTFQVKGEPQEMVGTVGVIPMSQIHLKLI